MLTENACYPAFVLAVLLIARALRSPSLANQAVALLGLGLVSLTRIQGFALAGGYLAAAATYAATHRVKAAAAICDGSSHGSP